MEQYLIYTNVVSDYLSNSIANKGALFIDKIINEKSNLSIITQIELLCWNTNNKTIKNIKYFLQESEIFDIISDVINHCVVIRKAKKINTPDAIIAATVLMKN